MVICILRGAPSAEARPYLGAVLVRGDAGGRLRAVLGGLARQVPQAIAVASGPVTVPDLSGIAAASVSVPASGTRALVLAALEWTAQHARATPWVVTLPVDMDPVPPDLVARFGLAVSEGRADLACGVVAGALHDGLGLWPVRLRRDLARFIRSDPAGTITDFAGRYTVAAVAFDTAPPAAGVVP
ncbi:MAG: hypothetical protein EA406_03515 [Rhodospirillales bacterium]|nr:MAG: hypothetical protein EA406_03515 [Rhodospirillales bacterium]